MLKMEKTLEDLLSETVCIVEASRYETTALFTRYEKQLSWDPSSKAFLKEIGTLDGRVVEIYMAFHLLKGKRVLFYHASSQVVDHKMIRLWFESNWKPVSERVFLDIVGVMNFQDCLHFLESLG